MDLGDLSIWSLVPPAIVFVLGQFGLAKYKNREEIKRFEKVLKPLAGEYTVHRKSGDKFPHMRKLKLSWDNKKYNALKFKHEKPLLDETQEKEKRGSTGYVYFKDEHFGEGFYKSNNTNHYGLASFILFNNGEIGYYRVYVRDDPSKAHMVSTNKEISTQFILKRKN
jgi:hypothetical protein